ncbi:hypothetical protein N5A93_06345 [Roseovarius sp. EGI FJ00037]|uniref:hypothetical protein n=1 Tax=Roseovarius salincola TaxID=2978479 RepID=UPI0022A8B2A1|nr:hypothetical protein [Roseovarius sp. EGI FJ00037]MCZ0811846.1 hypothetical protein [Roseovarius sp. EGI FJ00037]
MRNVLTSITLAGGLAMALPVGAQEERPNALQILGDIGPGGSPVREAVYAPRIRDLLLEEAMALELGDGDVIMLRTIGNPNLIEHLALADWNRDIAFGYGAGQAEDIPGFTAARIGQLAQIAPHSASDLMFALRELAPQTPCATHNVTTVMVTNFIEIGEVEGNRWWLRDIMQGAPFCGDLVIIGAWVADPNPVQGLREPALAFIQETFKQMGFENVSFRR